MTSLKRLYPQRLIRIEQDDQEIIDANNLSLDDWLFEAGDGFFDSGIAQTEKEQEAIAIAIESPIVMVDMASRIPSSNFLFRSPQQSRVQCTMRRSPSYSGIQQDDSFQEYSPIISTRNENNEPTPAALLPNSCRDRDRSKKTGHHPNASWSASPTKNNTFMHDITRKESSGGNTSDEENHPLNNVRDLHSRSGSAAAANSIGL
jgi:hypothetical protein